MTIKVIALLGKSTPLFILLRVFALCAPLRAQGRFEQYETSEKYTETTRNPLDALIVASLRQRDIEPANPCSDEVFVRRVYLDVIGTLPEPAEVRDFLQSPDSHKRAELIHALMERDEFADYWSLKWCDVLRVKAEFPINLWPNAVQAYHRWIHDCLRQNMPYDQFARELLTASGSNFRVPQVNLYRAIQGREPSAIAAAVALTFMGVRLDGWPQERQAGLEAFFGRVAYKTTAEWKEEIVYLDPATVSWYGGSDRRVQLVSGTGLWYKIGEGLVPVRWVFVHDVQGTHRDEYIYSTDPSLRPEQIVSWFTSRWPIETTFQEMRCHLGFETPRQYVAKSVLRTAPCLLGLFSVVCLIFAEHTRRHAVRRRRPQWYAKAEPTFSDAIAAVRRLFWQETIFTKASGHKDFEKLPPKVRNLLLDYLSQAA